MYNILITGGTGYLGLFITQKLLEKKYNVFVILRKNSISKIQFLKCKFPKNLHLIYFDFQDINKKINLPENIDTVIYLIGILKEINQNLTYKKVHIDWVCFFLKALILKYSPKIIDFIFLSAATGVPFISKNYFKTKLEAEKIIQKKKYISWLIIKAPLIYKKSIVQKKKAFFWIVYLIPIFNILKLIPKLGRFIFNYKPIEINEIYKIILHRINNKKSNIILYRKDLYLKKYNFNKIS